MNYLGVTYSNVFTNKSKENKYFNTVFLMPPWKDIYITDNERYESFEQSLAIHNHLKLAYKSLNYNVVEVPFNNVTERVTFILDKISN